MTGSQQAQVLIMECSLYQQWDVDVDVACIVAVVWCAVIDEQEIQLQIQMDAKNIERLSERAYCRDFSRLGFGSLTSQSRSRTEPFRLTMINSTYAVCPTYVIWLQCWLPVHWITEYMRGRELDSQLTALHVYSLLSDFLYSARHCDRHSHQVNNIMVALSRKTARTSYHENVQC